MSGMFAPPTQKQTTQSRTEPWGPSTPYLTGLLGSIGTQFGGTANMGAGFAPGIPGLPPGVSLPEGLPAGKRMALTGGAGGPSFDLGLTPGQSGALDALTANARNAGRYAPDIGLLAGDLFRGGTDRTGMVNDAYGAYRSALTPYATADTNPYTNEAFTKFSSGLQSDLTDALNSKYAAAGYSPVRSGDYGQQLGQGIARGLAPAWLDAYNQNEARKLGAINSLYGAVNTTAGLLGSLDQTALQSRLAGVNVGNAQFAAENAPANAALAIEAQRRGIPIQNAAQLQSLIIPMAQLGQQSNSTSTTQTQVPVGQQLLGAGLAGAGLLAGTGAFGPAGWLLSGAGGGGLLNGMFSPAVGAPMNILPPTGALDTYLATR